MAGQTRRLRLEVGNILSAGTNDGDYSKQRYDGKDPVQGLLNLVKREYGMTVDQSFEFVGINGGREAAASKRPRPFPLTLSTAQQLGVLPTRECASAPLSRATRELGCAPAGCRAYIQELLLHPPPRDTAAAISEACVLMSTGLSPSDGGCPGSRLFHHRKSLSSSGRKRQLTCSSPKSPRWRARCEERWNTTQMSFDARASFC